MRRLGHEEQKGKKVHLISQAQSIVLDLGPLAQSVEQRTFNPWVVGSIPTGPTVIELSSAKKFIERKRACLAVPLFSLSLKCTSHIAEAEF